MRRTIRPTLERLEGKELLSGLLTEGGLTYSLTALPTKTATGTVVVMTFTETNSTNHDIQVTEFLGYRGFTATQNGRLVWDSMSGARPQDVALETLKPNQSITLTGTWDGRPNQGDPISQGNYGPPLTGTFAISNESAPQGLSATVTLGSTAPPTHIVPPKPPAIHHH